ncbi:putative ribonuclease H-like domain-containing protein [Tanacetum coccineum]
MRPFGCPLTILNTLDPLGKFDGKSDEGYLLGYSTTSKAFRVYNKRTKRVEENMHIDFLEDQPNVVGSGPDWMFDLDFLTNTMNYIPVSVENQVNVDAGTQEHYVAGSSEKDKEPTQEYILLPLHPHRPRISVEDVVQAAQEKPSKNSPKDNDVQDSEDVAKKEEQHTLTEAEQVLKDDLERMIAQEIATKAIDGATRQAFKEEKKRAPQATSTNKLNTGRPFVSTSNLPLVSTANIPYASAASTPTSVNTGGSSFVYLGGQIPIDASTLPNTDLPIDPNMPELEDNSNVFPNDGIYSVEPMMMKIVHKDHPKGQILGDPKSAVQTRGKIQKASSVQQALVSYIYNKNRTNHKDHQNCLLACFLSQEEPKTISQALEDESWVKAMQEELLQFKLQKVWILVDLPFGKKAIGTKWVFRNKRDERSIVVKNKARLVAQGFRQEEGIDYDEVFAPVARIEAIRLFLAFASFMGFLVYQIDVKSAFLYGTIEEEVIKALYGLHHEPRAWYETLSSFLLENGFKRGIIDKTLFIKKNKSDIILVQVYVDDIIFGSTTQSMCTEFEDCMHKRFQISSMGELTFFLELQVKQQPEGIFISQDKYVADILKKFDFCFIKTATTPIESNKPLVKDEDGVDVDVHIYRSMIGSLMYLTASRPDIMFAVCACARFQVTPKASHLNAVKRIFRYLKHQLKLGLWYHRDSPFKLKAFSDSDYGGASLDRKSTTGGCQFLGRRLISWQCTIDYGFNFMNTKIHIDNESTICIVKNHVIRDCYEKRLIDVVKIHTDNNVVDLLTKGFDVTRFNFLVVNTGDYVPLLPAMLAGAAEDQGEGSAIPAEPQHTPTDPGPTFTHVADEATTIGVRVGTEGATTTTSGLDAGLDSGNIHKSPLRSYKAPLHEGHTSGSAEDNLQLKELMVLVPKLVTKIIRNILLLRHLSEVNFNWQMQQDSASGEAQEEEISPAILEAAKTLSQVASQTVSTYKRRVRSTDKGMDISTGLDAEAEVNTGSEDFNPDSIEVNTGSAPVSTPSVVQTVNVVIPSPVKKAIRLKALQDEEAARQVHFDALLAKRISEEQELSKQQKKRKAEIQEAAQMVEMINQKKKYYAKQKAKVEIRHHFIRDCYEKRLIDVIKIHTDANVADLLTKGFDVTRFNFLVVSIGMLNL